MNKVGSWSKKNFLQDTLGETALMFGGFMSQEREQAIVDVFDEVISFQDKIKHCYVVKKDGVSYTLAFNIWGSSMANDTVWHLYDGGVKNIIFLGYAYSLHNQPVGASFQVHEVTHYDGSRPDGTVVLPDSELSEKIQELLGSLQEGKIRSYAVPSVINQRPHRTYNPAPDIVEMELGAVYSQAKEIGIRAVGLVVISDNHSHSISKIHPQKDVAFYELTQKIVHSLPQLNLSALSSWGNASINKYLANVIELPERDNVYQKNSEKE